MKFEEGTLYSIHRVTVNGTRLRVPYNALCIQIGKENEYGEKKAVFMIGKKKMEYLIQKERYCPCNGELVKTETAALGYESDVSYILACDKMEVSINNVGKEIPLAEWAKKNNITPDTARQKAGRGALKTARKVGRDWVINEAEENTDGRRKGGKENG